MFGPRRYRHNSRLIVEQEETAALHSFISSATVYNLGLFISCTDVWFFLFGDFSLLLWSAVQSKTLLCLHSVLFPWHVCYRASDEWPWWLCFLFTTAHPLSRRCKQANTCMGTKSILSTGASIVWDSFLFQRNGESDYLQMDKEGQRLQSAYFLISLTWKKSLQTLHSCLSVCLSRIIWWILRSTLSNVSQTIMLAKKLYYLPGKQILLKYF